MNMATDLFANPETRLPGFSASHADTALLHSMTDAILQGAADWAQIDDLFAQTSFPQQWQRLILLLYAPGEKRILISRATTDQEGHSFSVVLRALLRHARCPALAAKAFRLQMDFIVEPPAPTDLYSIGVEQQGERHFEPGLDGLLFQSAEGSTRLFLPGDAYVRSVMGMRQLREYLYRTHSEETIRTTHFQRFRSLSFLSSSTGET